MNQSHISARNVLSQIQKLLASKAGARPEAVLEEVVDALYSGRHYFWIGIYLATGDKVVRQCFRGPVPPCHSFALGVGNVGTAGQSGLTRVIDDVSSDPTYSLCFTETKSEIVVPLRLGSRVVGVIDAESDRLGAFGERERALLTQVARLIARYLTTNPGKLVLRKVREKSREVKTETTPHKRPQSARPASSRAAAGEHAGR